MMDDRMKKLWASSFDPKQSAEEFLQKAFVVWAEYFPKAINPEPPRAHRDADGKYCLDRTINNLTWENDRRRDILRDGDANYAYCQSCGLLEMVDDENRIIHHLHYFKLGIGCEGGGKLAKWTKKTGVIQSVEGDE